MPSRPASNVLAALVSYSPIAIRPPKAFPPSFPHPPSALLRADQTPDSAFYASPRFCYHIDDGAVESLNLYYAYRLPPPRADRPVAVLDLASSWVSHIPLSPSPAPPSGSDHEEYEVTGLGLSRAELDKNELLAPSRRTVLDLNASPTLPYPDSTFDLVVCTVSIDYLEKAREVLGEVGRVLRPGASCELAISDRCFPTKVVAIWHELSKADRLELVAGYFHFALSASSDPPGSTPPGSVFEEIEIVTVVEEQAGWRRTQDPLWVVRARRRA